jgi:hypothetical protein
MIGHREGGEGNKSQYGRSYFLYVYDEDDDNDNKSVFSVNL